MARKSLCLRLFGVCVVLFPVAASSRAAEPANPASAAREWRTHGGDPGHTQYSPLAQIDTTNVGRLKQAWIHRTGDARKDDKSHCCAGALPGEARGACSAAARRTGDRSVGAVPTVSRPPG